jgi:iron complex transport system substrate-binding protein
VTIRPKSIIVNTLVKGGLTPQEIDKAVRTQIANGGTLYFVDLPKLEEIQPDVVITQDLCRVCAISTPDLAKAISELEFSSSSHLASTPHNRTGLPGRRDSG